MTEADLCWDRFQRGWAVAVLTLLAATWRLWIPSSDFPQVPMIALPAFAGKVDLIAVVTMVASLGFIAASRRTPRSAFVLLLISLLLTFIVNQHRLQPWAYQAALHCLMFTSLSPRSSRRWMIAISISIYFYSACGKFDFQFLHTVGQEFIARVLGPADGPPSRLRLLLAACLPATELAIAIGLCLPRLHRAAGIAAMSFHAALIVMLSPWLLGHSIGVLLWNVWLMMLAWELFVSPRAISPRAISPSARAACPQEDQNETGWGARAPLKNLVVHLVLLAALLLPLCERTGYWDHWLSWSLYSPHTSRAEIELHQSVRDLLPESAKPFVLSDEEDDGWDSLAIDRWSLETLGVPIYPQARFQLGMARSIAKSITRDDAIRVKLRSVSDRWNGTRVEQWLYIGPQADRRHLTH